MLNSANFRLDQSASINDHLIPNAQALIAITASAVQDNVIVDHDSIAENNPFGVSDDHASSEDHAASDSAEKPWVKQFSEKQSESARHGAKQTGQ